jgi:shikimate kinase / 3-dehydroquinate synthase
MEHIFLYGPSGSGKSTVGKILAQNLALGFVDLDVDIERRAGMPITQIMSELGEKGFRKLESSALERACGGNAAVIALGGGTLLQESNRALAESNGPVLFLDADIATLTGRLSKTKNQRPLLAGELAVKLKLLLENRKSHYSSFNQRVDATESPEKVAWSIQQLLGRFHVQGSEQDYDVINQAGGLDALGDLFQQRNLGGPVVVVSDTHVAPLYLDRALVSLRSAGYKAIGLVIQAEEANKTIEAVSALWKGFLTGGMDRHGIVIALGGGVVSDLAGFAAATYLRGCDWVVVPTTLLSMVDASLGGKTGFDLAEGKNLVGAFHSPRLVLTDLEVLSTLPEEELRSGLAEALKHGVIDDPKLFDLCAQGWKGVNTHLAEVVKRAIAVKVKIITADPYEKNIRAALNFGHTVGHAIELVSGFSLRHGEAVAIGMVVEARLAEHLGYAEKGLADKLAKSLTTLGLPVRIPDNFPQRELIRVMRVDKKKSAGVVHFSLPVQIGKVQVGVAVEKLEMVFEEA